MDTSAKTGFNVKEIFVAIGAWCSLPLIILETLFFWHRELVMSCFLSTVPCGHCSSQTSTQRKGPGNGCDN
jgi:hypothetical protein